MTVQRSSYVKISVPILLGAVLLIINASCILASTSMIHLCPGGKLTLMCSTNGALSRLDLLQWNVTVPHLDPSDSGPTTSLVSTVSPQLDLPLLISNVLFNITRDSTAGTLPLVSTLTVTNVTAALNGTVVECTTDDGHTLVLMKTINIIRTGHKVHPRPPVINRTNVFEDDTIIVTLGWMAENGVTYNISIIPQVPITKFSDTSVKLRVSYNTSYSVTVLTTLCGQNSVNSTLEIYFVRCAAPISGAMMENSLVRVAADKESDIFLGGANITFTCPAGLVVTGPTTLTCMENGEWEPDVYTLRQLKCKANCGTPIVKNTVILTYNSTLEGSQLEFWCDGSPNDTFMAVCHRDGGWSVDLANYDCSKFGPEKTSRELSLIIAMVTSVFSFTTIFFIIGCICGQLWRKCKQSTETCSSDVKHIDLQPSQTEHTSSQVGHTDQQIITTEQVLEMTENVAYLKCTVTQTN